MKSQTSNRIESWLRYESVSCKLSTLGCYRTALVGFCRWLTLKKSGTSILKQIALLNESKLKDYLFWLSKQNLEACTRIHYALAVKKYLAWEVQQKTINVNILTGLDRSHFPKMPEYLPRPLSSENDKLLQEKLKLSKSPYAPSFLLLRHTGLRISELINLPPDCVLTTPNNDRYLKVPLGKMNTERLVPLSNDSIDLIDKIKKEQLHLKPKHRSSKRLIGIEGNIPHVYGHLTHKFKNITGDMLDQGKRITFHRLRHTYATSLLSGGVGLLSLMKLLGHKRIEMTLRYTKVTPTHLRNEYLKAIKIIENGSHILEIQSQQESSSEQHPSEIIANLIAFMNGNLKHNLKKNILRRLNHLQLDISNLSFSKKFKLRTC